MHHAAYNYVKQALAQIGPVASAVEFAGMDVNETTQGLSIRGLLDCDYLSIDLHDGPGVMLVADCATWQPDRTYDLVLCCELLEHTDKGRDIIGTAHKALATGGWLILTCATIGRRPHGAHGGSAVPEGEHYANIQPNDLSSWVTEHFGAPGSMAVRDADLYLTVQKT